MCRVLKKRYSRYWYKYTKFTFIATKLFLGGDPTHTQEFSIQEFIQFIQSEFTVLEYKRSSCIARFSPFVNKILQIALRGDIIVKAKKQ